MDMMVAIALGFLALFVLGYRTNVALGILGLTAGYVFSDLLSEEIVGYIYANNYDDGSLPLLSIISIVLIVTPSFVILRRFRHYQKGRYVQHLLPSIGYVLLMAVLLIENLPLKVSNYLTDNSFILAEIERLNIYIAVVVVGVAVLDVVMHESEHKRRLGRMRKKAKKSEE